MKPKSHSPQKSVPPPLAGGGRGRGSARVSEHAVEGQRETLEIREGAVAPYLPHRHSRAGGNPATLQSVTQDGGIFIDGDWVESKDQDPDGDVRLIQLADIGVAEYRDRSSRFLTSQKAKELGCTYIRPGDVLVARMPEPLGRACIYPGDEKPAVTVVDVCIVRPNPKIANARWLVHRINAPDFREKVASFERGSTRKRISRKNLAIIEFDLPPLAEQRRIVAELETQLTRLDASVTALKRVQANLKRYRASVLKAACEGRLVPTEAELARREGRTYESGDDLLALILKQRRTATCSRGPYREPSEATNPSATPEGWASATAEQLGHVQLGRQRSPKNRSRDFPTKYIRAANITQRGLDLSDVLDMEFSPAELGRYVLRFGDIVLSEASGSPDQVGKPAMWRDELPNCCFQNTVIRLRAVVVEPMYLLVLFKSFYFNGVFARVAGGVGINHLSADKFSSMHVPLPPLVEQTRIVAEVERRLSVIEELEATVAANLKRAERLRQSVLARAFGS